jgi:hypothetical protein
MLKEIFHIDSYPDLETDRPFSDKLILLLKIYGCIFLLNLLSVPISTLAEWLVTNVLHLKSITANFKTSMHSFFTKYGTVEAAIYICILAPLLEETIFRLPLSFKKQHVAIALGCALLLFVRVIPVVNNFNLLSAIAVRAVLFVLGYFTLMKLLPANTDLNKRAQTGFIILSMLLFGLMHIFNYAPMQWTIIFMYPFFVIPQLIMGWALTYIRFKNGFFWGVALHSLVNSVSVLTMLSVKNPYV